MRNVSFVSIGTVRKDQSTLQSLCGTHTGHLRSGLLRIHRRHQVKQYRANKRWLILKSQLNVGFLHPQCN
jgi:hypothetical protein